jgi:putative endonuclease
MDRHLSMSIINVLAQFFSRKPTRVASGSSRAERGQFGEDLAADHCKRTLGYKLIARNWRWKRDELDLVCLDGEVLVFVEVRARAADALVGGYHSIGAKKKKTLVRGCKAYIKQLQNPPKHFRFDVIDVAISEDGEGDVRHYSNVPLFSKLYISQP